MPQPRLDDQQTTQALQNYIAAREQAVRYVLSALDPTAFDAPARPFLAVLTRVQELIAAEIGRYAEEAPAPAEADEAPPVAEEEVQHRV